MIFDTLSVGASRHSEPFDEELRAYLETRLGTLSLVLAVLFWTLAGLFVTSSALGDERSVLEVLVEYATSFPNAIVFFLGGATSAIYIVLRLRRVSRRGLAALDGMLLQLLVGPCLILYAREHTFSFSGFAYVVPFLVLFVLARAILIPSSGFRTAVLSLPAPLGVFAVQLQRGASFAFPDTPYPESHFVDTLVQNQVVLLGALGVAIVASRVNLSLRRRSYDARGVGQYRLLEPIGRGAMGEVHLATHSLLKRRTAIKFLRPEIAGESALARFEQEVRLAASLTHPNTISIYDYGYTAEGVFYYAMELVHGETLRQIVGSHGRLPPSRMVHILGQACGALNEAHEKGIVHRDIKTANITLGVQGGIHDFVKILDYGVAKRLENRSKQSGVGADGSRTVAGSLETLAPEALEGGGVGPRSDLYALGVVAYNLVTGRALFDAKSGQELIRHHIGTEPIPPSRFSQAMSRELEEIVLWCLRKEPTGRPESAAALKRALDDVPEASRWSEEDAREWWSRFTPSETRGDPMSDALSDSFDATRVRDSDRSF